MVYVVDSGEDQPPYNSLRRKNIPTLTTPAEDLINVKFFRRIFSNHPVFGRIKKFYFLTFAKPHWIFFIYKN